MVQLTKVGNNANVPVEQWTCDTFDEIQALDVVWGTRAYCIATKKWYIKTEISWQELGSAGGGTTTLNWESI